MKVSNLYAPPESELEAFIDPEKTWRKEKLVVMQMGADLPGRSIPARARAEYSLDPQSIENTIRKKLLPKLFKRIGMDKAREVIDQVIHIARLGPASEVA